MLEELKVLRANGTPWDESTCSSAAKGGHLEVLQWLRTKGCPWDEGTCDGRRRAGTSRCCSGRTRTAARGTRRRARARRGAGISRCCSGRARTAARGTQRRARARRRAGTSRCCSGCARTAARGTRHVRGGGGGRASRDAAVGARERLPVGREARARRRAKVGHLEVLQWALDRSGLQTSTWLVSSETPLYVAAQNGREAMVSGADRGGRGRQQGNERRRRRRCSCRRSRRPRGRWCGR